MYSQNDFISLDAAEFFLMLRLIRVVEGESLIGVERIAEGEDDESEDSTSEASEE